VAGPFSNGLPVLERLGVWSSGLERLTASLGFR
jgi:hypothetical protein